MSSDGNIVLDAVVTRLKTIRKANGFGFDVEFVERKFCWPDDIGQRFPALIVLPSGVQPLEKSLQSNYQMVNRSVSVLCYVYEQHDPASALEDFQADILKCLFSEPALLGGAVRDIRWSGSDSSANVFSVVGFSVGYTAPIGVARVDFVVSHDVYLLGGA